MTACAKLRALACRASASRAANTHSRMLHRRAASTRRKQPFRRSPIHVQSNGTADGALHTEVMQREVFMWISRLVLQRHRVLSGELLTRPSHVKGRSTTLTRTSRVSERLPQTGCRPARASIAARSGSYPEAAQETVAGLFSKARLCKGAGEPASMFEDR